MIDPTQKRLSVSRQCRMLGTCRSSRYYKRRQRIQSDDLKLMRLIDEQYLKTLHGAVALCEITCAGKAAKSIVNASSA
jgi:hypothetical protein